MDKRIEDAREFWDRTATSYGAGAAVGRPTATLDDMVLRISAMLGIGQKSQVLDVCCGNGLITNKVAASCASIVGADISGEMLKKGRAAAKDMKVWNTRYLQGDSASLPFADDTFDVTYCLSSFHIFPSYDYAAKVLAELLRVTKPTGKILIAELPWKGTLGNKIWNLIRSREGTEVEGYVPFQDLPFYKRVYERLRLVLRRFTGRRVASDNWLWFDCKFFQQVIAQGKFSNIQTDRSPKKRIVIYQNDVVISNYPVQSLDK